MCTKTAHAMHKLKSTCWSDCPDFGIKVGEGVTSEVGEMTSG